MKDLRITKARLVDVNQCSVSPPTEVYCRDGQIQAMGDHLDIPEGVATFDLKGLWLCPGLIDMHVQLRDPGEPEEETIASGVAAAKAGGYTGIVCTPNTDPSLDTGSLIEYLVLKGHKNEMPIYPLGALTKGLKGEYLSEMGDLKRRGAIGFADTEHPTMNSEVMRRAMEYVKSLGVPAFVDCEDVNLAAGGVIHEGVQASICGLKGIPRQAESLMVARNLALAELTGCAIHVQCVSTKESVALIAQAKQRGVRVTAETSPAYFALCCEDMKPYDSSSKLRPPLRTAQDREAVKQGLMNDVIDVIVSAHSPQRWEEKHLELDYAPFGAVGLETCVGVTLTQFANEKDEIKAKILAKMSLNPAQILGLPLKGRLQEGYAADMTVIDPESCWTVDPQIFHSQSYNTPFAGWELQGEPVGTIIAGYIVYSNLA